VPAEQAVTMTVAKTTGEMYQLITRSSHGDGVMSTGNTTAN